MCCDVVLMCHSSHSIKHYAGVAMKVFHSYEAEPEDGEIPL
jgi:hypothetical protein